MTEHDQQAGKCLIHPQQRAHGCPECAKMRAYPVSLCPRCKQPMMQPWDGLCSNCHKMQNKQKHLNLDRRYRELVRKNRDVIDFTGYEDIRADLKESRA